MWNSWAEINLASCTKSLGQKGTINNDSKKEEIATSELQLGLKSHLDGKSLWFLRD